MTKDKTNDDPAIIPIRWNLKMFLRHQN